jgi:hypothetical protein
MPFKIECNKSFITKDNAIKAIKDRGFDHLRYFIMKAEDGKHKDRYFPVFVGNKPIEEGVHFHFNVVG